MNPEGKSMEIEKLGTLVANKRDLYDILKNTYVLPEYYSHACTLRYLNKYTQHPILIYTCEIKGTEIFNPRYRNANAEELLHHLEEVLAKKQKLPTGLDIFSLPDVPCCVLYCTKKIH